MITFSSVSVGLIIQSFPCPSPPRQVLSSTRGFPKKEPCYPVITHLLVRGPTKSQKHSYLVRITAWTCTYLLHRRQPSVNDDLTPVGEAICREKQRCRCDFLCCSKPTKRGHRKCVRDGIGGHSCSGKMVNEMCQGARTRGQTVSHVSGDVAWDNGIYTDGRRANFLRESPSQTCWWRGC